MQQDFFLNQNDEPVSIKGAQSVNPLLRYFGKGPEGERCKNCEHLYYKSYSKKYYKCDLRKDTASTKTDHRVNWPACGKFIKQTND